MIDIDPELKVIRTEAMSPPDLYLTLRDVWFEEMSLVKYPFCLVAWCEGYSDVDEDDYTVRTVNGWTVFCGEEMILPTEVTIQ